MASHKEDNIPLVAVKPHKSNYFRATSCFEEPEVSCHFTHFLVTTDASPLALNHMFLIQLYLLTEIHIMNFETKD